MQETPKFHLPYLSRIGEDVTPEMEFKRYTTIDVQMEAIFSVLGDGVVSGWGIQAEHPQTKLYDSGSVWIVPGRGHIGSLAGETLASRKLGGLIPGSATSPQIFYIHAATSEFTAINKDIIFFAAESIYDDSTSLLLAKVTITGTSQSSIIIDNSVRKSIGFSGAMIAGLLAHKHGKDGISKIDLGTEVRGVLSGENIADIDAERIIGGEINPERFVLSHFDLIESGQISHAELDSLVTFLQKSNKKLFGDITTSNLCQLAVTAKEVNESVDKYFRNMITIIPGLGVDKFADERSRIQPETIIASDRFDAATGLPMEETYVIGTNTYAFRSDAAIGYFGPGGYITGVPTTATKTFGLTTDTKPEFDGGVHNDEYMSVEVNPDNPNAAIVKLIPGGADYLLYTTSLTPELSPPSSNNSIESHLAAGYVNHPSKWAAVMELPNTYTMDVDGGPVLAVTNPKWRMMLRFGYNVGDGGQADPPKLVNPKLHYLLDTADATKSSYWNWASVQSLQFRFGTGTGTFTVVGNWKITLEDYLGNIYSNTLINAGTHNFSTIIAFALTGIPGPFDLAKVSKITIHNADPLYQVIASTDNTRAIPWADNISSISLGGTTFFSSVPSNNTIDRIYLNIPENAVATFIKENTNMAGSPSNANMLTWKGFQPGDTLIEVQIKTVDASATGAVGTSLLFNKSWESSGNSYSTIVPGGRATYDADLDIFVAEMTTEPPGTHLEIRVILHPSSDGLSSPELYSIRIDYTVAGELKSLEWSNTSGWEIDIAQSTTNIDQDISSNLYLADTTDIDNYIFGQSGSVSFYKSPNQDKIDGTFLPLVPGQTEPSLGKVCAVKRMADGNLLVADTMNHRIVKINSVTGNDEFIISGSVAENKSGAMLEVHSAFYNRDSNFLWVNFSHVVTTGTIDSSKWNFATPGNIKLLTSTDSEPIFIKSNGMAGSPASGFSTIGISLNTVDARFVRENPGVQIVVDAATTTSTVATGKNIVATNILPAKIYYRDDISFPIDISIDQDENIIIAQAIGVESPNSGFRILKINSVDYGGPSTYSIDSSSDGINFKFGKTLLGSVQEITNISGDKELIIADEGNDRVLRVMASSGQKIWSIPSPVGFGPTCAFLSEDGYVYIAYGNRATSGYVAKYSPSLVKMREYVSTGIAIPRDVGIVGDKLIISV